MKHLLLIVLTFISSLSLLAQEENSHIREGNDLYAEENYADAEVEYRKAIEINPESFKATFNLGAALFNQEKYEEAIKEFKNITARETDKKRLANTWYNIGNSYMEQKQYQPAADAYKEALRNNPTDMDAKYNLAYAQKLLQDQQNQGGGQNQQNQDQNQDQNKDNKDQQDKQDQQNQDQNNQNNQNKDKKDDRQQQNQQNKDQNKDQNKQDQQNRQQQQPQKNQISKEDAARLLEAMKKNEEDTRQKVEKKKMQQAQKVRIEKDW